MQLYVPSVDCSVFTNMSGPILYNVFDASRLTFEKVSKTKRGSKTIKMGYQNSKSNILIQTPPLKLPMGLSIYSEEEGSMGSASIPASLDSQDPKIEKFLHVLRDIENQVLRHCAENSVEIFGRQLSADTVSTMYTSPIKEGRAKTDGPNAECWPPLLRVKISQLTPPLLFDMDRNEQIWESTQGQYKRYTVRMIMQMQPIWFVGKGFGVSFRLQQMSIVDVPPQQDICMFIDDGSLSGKGMLDDDDDDDDAV